MGHYQRPLVLEPNRKVLAVGQEIWSCAMNDGMKLIVGIFVVLGMAYFAGSMFFPELVRTMSLTPIEFNWHAF